MKYLKKKLSNSSNPNEKNVLFVINNMDIGGIQKSLINLLNNIPDSYEIDLLIFSKDLVSKYEIPNNVNLIKTSRILNIIGTPLKKLKKQGSKISKIILSGFSRIFGAIIIRKVLYFFLKKNHVHYSTAISYSHDISDKNLSTGTNDYVLQCINADKKITFLHTDVFQNYDVNKKNYSRYKLFDKIVCVSDSCKYRLDSLLPGVKNKTLTLHNFTDKDYIIKMANINTIEYNKKFINVLTVSRLSHEKGIDRFIPVFVQLHREGLKIKWHIIGDGPDKDDLEKLILKESASEFIHLYGNQRNPYRYMKNVDYLLVTSRFEAAPLVYDEAATLQIPIVTTETVSANEMVEVLSRGTVIENNDSTLYVNFKNAINPIKKYEFKHISNELKKEIIMSLLGDDKNV